MSERKKIGDNITISIKEGKLILEVNLQVDELKPSKSGKTLIIASSRGNQKIQYNNEDIFIGLNVYKKPDA